MVLTVQFLHVRLSRHQTQWWNQFFLNQIMSIFVIGFFLLFYVVPCICDVYMIGNRVIFSFVMFIYIFIYMTQLIFSIPSIIPIIDQIITLVSCCYHCFFNWWWSLIIFWILSLILFLFSYTPIIFQQFLVPLII